MEEKKSEEILAEINKLREELNNLILNYEELIVPETASRGIEEQAPKMETESLKEYSEDIKTEISKLKEDIRSIGKKTIKGVKTLVNLAKNKISNKALALKTAGKRAIKDGVKKGKEFVEEKVEGAKEWVDDKKADVKEWADDKKAVAKEWIGDKKEKAAATVETIKDRVEDAGKRVVGAGFVGAIVTAEKAKKVIKGAKTLVGIAKSKVNKKVLELRTAGRDKIKKGKEFVEEKVEGAKEWVDDKKADAKEWIGDKKEKAAATVETIKDRVEDAGKRVVGAGFIGAMLTAEKAKKVIKGAKTLVGIAKSKVNKKVLALRTAGREKIKKGKEFVGEKVEDAKEWIGEKKEAVAATVETIKEGISDKYEEASSRFQKRKNQTIISTLKMVKSVAKKLEDTLDERISTKEELAKKAETREQSNKESVNKDTMEL